NSLWDGVTGTAVADLGDGKAKIVAAGQRGLIQSGHEHRLIDATTGALIAHLGVHALDENTPVSSDGRRVVLVDSARVTIRILDTMTGQRLAVISANLSLIRSRGTRPIESLSFAGEDRFLIVSVAPAWPGLRLLLRIDEQRPKVIEIVLPS